MKEELKVEDGCVRGEVYELNQSSDENGNTVVTNITGEEETIANVCYVPSLCRKKDNSHLWKEMVIMSYCSMTITALSAVIALTVLFLKIFQG